MAGPVTLAELRSRAKARADMVGSSFVTDAEWNVYLNHAADELYDLLVVQYEDDFAAELALSFPTGASDVDVSSEAEADSGAPMLKLLSVGVTLGGRYSELQRYTRADRAVLRNATSGTPRYQLRGSILSFLPNLPAASTLAVEYVPQRAELISDADRHLLGWDEFVVLGAAIKALGKEESDPSVLMAEKAALDRRIRETAPKRDLSPNNPSVVRDVYAEVDRNGEW